LLLPPPVRFLTKSIVSEVWKLGRCQCGMQVMVDRQRTCLRGLFVGVKRRVSIEVEEIKRCTCQNQENNRVVKRALSRSLRYGNTSYKTGQNDVK
jgi:hypothetical protein